MAGHPAPTAAPLTRAGRGVVMLTGPELARLCPSVAARLVGMAYRNGGDLAGAWSVLAGAWGVEHAAGLVRLHNADHEKILSIVLPGETTDDASGPVI